MSVLNELQECGAIKSYAIGGAIAATFYIEPVLTYDLDVFVLLTGAENPLAPLSSIYEALRTRGFSPDKEHVIIEGVPVQLLPAYNSLIEEAVSESNCVAYGAVSTRVVRAEHLAAIMLQTYRPKDKTRLAQICNFAKFDRLCFLQIVERHGLQERWHEYRRDFGER